MRIDIRGDMASRHDLMRRCVDFVIRDHNMIGPNYKGMSIIVNIGADIKGSGELLVDPAECVPDAEEPPTTFHINLRRQSFMKVMTTLCHELVHVFQFRTGEAYYLPCGSLTYLGIVINPDDYNNRMEWLAFGREKFLAQLFCDQNNLTRQSWYVCPFT